MEGFVASNLCEVQILVRDFVCLVLLYGAWSNDDDRTFQ